MSISKYRTGKILPCFEFFDKLVGRETAVKLNWQIGNQEKMFLDPAMKAKSPKSTHGICWNPRTT